MDEFSLKQSPNSETFNASSAALKLLQGNLNLSYPIVSAKFQSLSFYFYNPDMNKLS